MFRLRVTEQFKRLVGRLPLIGTRGNVNNLVPTKAIVLNVKSRLGELRGGPRERSEGISDPDAAVAAVAMAHALPGSALGTRLWARLRPGSCPGAGGDSGASYRPLATARRQILTWDRIAPTGSSGDPCPHRPLPRRRRSGTGVD